MCCICLIETNEKNITLNCGHRLHKKCLIKMIDYHNKCPLCRLKIFEENICKCSNYAPHFYMGKCRFCTGICKKELVKKYYNI